MSTCWSRRSMSTRSRTRSMSTRSMTALMSTRSMTASRSTRSMTASMSTRSMTWSTSTRSMTWSTSTLSTTGVTRGPTTAPIIRPARLGGRCVDSGRWPLSVTSAVFQTQTRWRTGAGARRRCRRASLGRLVTPLPAWSTGQGRRRPSLLASSWEEVEEEAVHLLGRLELHPVSHAVEALVAARTGDEGGRARHLRLGEGDVAAAPHAHRRCLDRRQLERRAQRGLRAGRWPGTS